MTSSFINRYERARESCVLFHLETWAVFELIGPDTRDYLQRISTADMRDLKPGDGKQTLFLQGDGRLVGDCAVLCESDDKFRIVCPGTCRASLAEQIDRFLFTEKVEFAEVTAAWYVAMIAGPKSRLLQEAMYDICRETGVAAQVAPVRFAPASERVVVLLDHKRFPEVRGRIYEKLESLNGINGDLDMFEAFRVEEGWPIFGVDLTSRTIPLEAGQKAAISFTKGCFPGQEIVARINNLGHPANVLVGLLAPETTEKLAGQELLADGKVVGQITTVCFSPRVRGILALGYVKWNFREPGQELQVAGHDGLAVSVINLPLEGLDS